jgi:hypothetical protein
VFNLNLALVPTVIEPLRNKVNHLSISYQGILNKAKIRKHKTENIQYQIYKVQLKLLHISFMY